MSPPECNPNKYNIQVYHPLPSMLSYLSITLPKYITPDMSPSQYITLFQYISPPVFHPTHIVTPHLPICLLVICNPLVCHLSSILQTQYAFLPQYDTAQIYHPTPIISPPPTSMSPHPIMSLSW